MLKSFKQLGANLFLGLGGVIFALGIGEIGLRILGISYPSFYQADPHRGHAFIPNLSGWWTHEGKGWVSTNQQGLRDKDYALEKPPNTFRIAILGDSFAEAIQVNAEETFWSFMEQNLAKCDRFKQQNIEVINFGVGDYGTAQQLMTLRHQASKYSPDLVILAVFTGNDIINNSKALSPPERFSPFLIKKDGDYRLDLSFNQTETYQWRSSLPRKIMFSVVNHSRILQVINEARVAFKNQRTMLGNQMQPEDENIINSLDFTPELYQESDQNWQEAWEITEKLISLINQEIKALDADFLAVTLSNPAQVYPDATLRKKYFENAGITDPFYPDKRIASLGGKEGFDVLMLAPQFQGYADTHNSYLHGFDNTVMGSGHWNQLGHQLAGKLITEEVCTNAQ